MDNMDRRRDILQALEKFDSPTATLSIQDMANIWGCQRARFVSIKNSIPNFPDPVVEVEGDEGVIRYPATVALQAMLAHVEAALRVETPLPRGAGAEVPQSPIDPASMPLTYSEQNFNALVAANTALQSEIFGLQSLLDSRNELIDDLRKMLDQAQEMADKIAGDAAEAQLKMDRVIADLKKQLVVEEANHGHTKRLVEVANQRVARASGYIDRVLDDEARLDPPVQMPSRPLPPAPKGPALDEIYDPRPPRQETDGYAQAMMGTVRNARFEDEYAGRRRY